METDHMEDLRVDGKIILKLSFKKWDREAWTGLLRLRIRDSWRALVNTVMNFGWTINMGYFLTSW